MFTEMITTLARDGQPDPARLRQRFRLALTKKLAVVRLPPAFWVQDPKINPRADHLFWAALLLDDREGLDLVSSVIAVELAEQPPGRDVSVGERLAGLAEELLDLVPPDRRDRLRQQVDRLLGVRERAPEDPGPETEQGKRDPCRK